MASKAKITLNGVPLAATSSVVWRFQTGTTPYTTVFTVHRAGWNQLRGLLGQDAELDIVDARGESVRIRGVTPLHVVPSDSKYRVSFLVADRRWKWAYKLIARDYNIAKKTGDRTIVGGAEQFVPIEAQVTVDEYDYRPYSLKEDGKKWTAKDAVIDVLEKLTETGGRRRGYIIESFPVNSEGEDGQFSLQNIVLRDSGDAALARLLSYIPGAEVYIDKDGIARVIDAADLQKTRAHLETLPPERRDGEYSTFVDRSKIRPKRVVVHYQREVELLAEFQDDFNPTQTEWRSRQRPFLDNVIPTVDPSTVVGREFDPEKETFVDKTVAQGTWVEVKNWLEAMDADKPENSLPWTFETIRKFWVRFDLEGVLGAGQKIPDTLETGNAAARVSALREHFRQTFRLNRTLVERVRDMMDVRVATIDPVTGARAPAAVWSQYCIIPSGKGIHMPSRQDFWKDGMAINVDALQDSADGEKIIKTTPSAAGLVFRDKDLGIFRVEPILSPFGTDASIIPCHVVTERGEGTPTAPSYNMAKQDEDPIAFGMRVEGTTAGLQLRKSMRLKALFTIVPAAPNNARQFHKEIVEVDSLDSLFAGEYGIKGGDGPDLEVFVPPGEATARFAWDNDEDATQTISDLLALQRITRPQDAGVDGPELPGFVFVNYEREIKPHARAVAAEMMAAFADNVQGSVSTIIPPGGVKLVGNMSSAAIQASSFPSGNVSAVHEFPGQQKPVSRFAMLPEAARLYVLGIVAYKASR